MSGPGVTLREVRDSDLPIFFVHQSDKGASHSAAVASKDRETFDAHWIRIRADETVAIRTIVWQEQVAGNVLSFERNGIREVGYWIGRGYWGKGIATRALAGLLDVDNARPLHGRVAGDNLGSIRVLEKCGFERVSSRRAFDETRGEEIEDLLLVLR
jgi:RimJ/RimL family protein N-acetyltransferase